MDWKPESILSILDGCCEIFSFPMLDNGYVYLAATRLSLYRSETDWAMVIEVFGYSPREGTPSVAIHTFASRLHDRNPPEQYINRSAYENYLANHPHDEFRSAYPIENGHGWQDRDCDEYVARDATAVVLRGRTVPLPSLDDYARYGIALEEAPRVRVFELCRALAHSHRDEVLAMDSERRVSVLPHPTQVLLLEEWHHPNVVDAADRPSGSETFQQIARVLVSGNPEEYRPTRVPNTHWRYWPEGGTL
jgi:hypothetical protein